MAQSQAKHFHGDCLPVKFANILGTIVDGNTFPCLISHTFKRLTVQK